jgi:hypothetical protein
MVPSSAGDAGSAGVAGPLPAHMDTQNKSTRLADAEIILRIVVTTSRVFEIKKTLKGEIGPDFKPHHYLLNETYVPGSRKQGPGVI